MKTTIPFSGFYYSVHDQELDYILEQCFSNDCGDVYNSLAQSAHDNADWFSIHSGYAKLYTEAFAKEFELETVKFKKLDSPKYYNFETDRIFCEINISEVNRLYKTVCKKVLEDRIQERFTSRDGFISFYPNELAKWPNKLEDWDINQVGTLIEAYTVHVEPEFLHNQFKEYDLLEDYRCNGVIENLLYENIENAERLDKIYRYLRDREDRI
jgi:hypothetical protein